MTFRAMVEMLDKAKAIGAELGPEAIQERGLEGVFVRTAMSLESYADGFQDAGGSLEQLNRREMDEGYAVEINDLLRRINE